MNDICFFLQMHYMELLPYLLFSSIAVISGLLILCLPETFNRHLPDTIEDVKNIGRKNEEKIYGREAGKGQGRGRQ